MWGCLGLWDVGSGAASRACELAQHTLGGQGICTYINDDYSDITDDYNDINDDYSDGNEDYSDGNDDYNDGNYEHSYINDDYNDYHNSNDNYITKQRNKTNKSIKLIHYNYHYDRNNGLVNTLNSSNRFKCVH